MDKDLYNLFVEREKKIRAARNFLDEHTDSAKKISVNDAETADKMISEAEALSMRIANELDNQPTMKPILAQPYNPFETVQNSYQKFGISGAEYRKNFFNQIRTGFKTAQNVLQESPLQQGGFLLPVEMHDSIITALTAENVLRQISRVVQTANDRKLVIQATPPVASFVSEGQQITLSSETFDQKILGAYKIAAACAITNELLSDSFYDIEAHLQTEFSRAIGALEENAFLNGTGNNEPLGILPTLAADSSTTITTTGAAISADDIINLCYSLKRPYRKNACWLMNDSTLAVIRTLKDNNQAFIWQTGGFSTGEPPTILGYPVYTSEFVPQIARGNIAVLFGDFSRFIIAQRGELIFKPLHELRALSDESVFLMITRIDGVLSDSQSVRGLKIA